MFLISFSVDRVGTCGVGHCAHWRVARLRQLARVRQFLGMVLLATAGQFGCNSAATERNEPTTETKVEANNQVGHDEVVQDAAHEATDVVRVATIDRDGFTQFLAQQRGKVVLVDFWATWCPACMEGFPDTVALSHKYREQGLIVSSLALEDLESEPQVLSFLQQQGAGFANFISAYGGSDARSMDEFELGTGTIPTLKLYDRKGELRQTFGDGLPFSTEQIEVAIRQLLLEQ